MEEKINNQKIFSYIPSLIARLILNSTLQDKDIFSENVKLGKHQRFYSMRGKNTKGRSTFLTSLFINPSIYPINHYLPNTIVMNIRLKGFQKLISSLSIKDPKEHLEKTISEYLSIITPKFLLKISEIISKNGGEIIKYNDYEFTTIWNFIPKKHKIPRYEKFYAKQALISACEIMKELDNKEIVNGIKIKISIGIAMGKTMIGFFGGERKRGEYIVMGETIQNAEICINYCLSHEIIISEEVNRLFLESDEITTKEIYNKENINLYSITHFNENILKNFKGFKIKMKSDKLNMTKTVYENLAKKVYIFSSILPQGLVKYLDVGQDQNLKEISVVTIATMHIQITKGIINDLRKIQNIILDIQKATYLTFGSLLYISKTYNGLLVRCVWGMDPGSFLDDTARCISTAILIGSLADYYDIKIGIGISTGSCYSGLIPIQGDRKQFTLLGQKVNLSRTLADEAFQKVINNNNINIKKKYMIYCDKNTVKRSQKWFRHVYISKIVIYFNKDSEELYYETMENEEDNKSEKEKPKKGILNFSDDEESHKNFDKDIDNNDSKFNDKIYINETQDNTNNDSNSNYHSSVNSSNVKKSRNNSSLFGEYNRKNTANFKKTIVNTMKEKIYIIGVEIYSPIEQEEYFIQNINDPFPLLRTHRNNSYNPKIKQYFYNHSKKKYYDKKINVNLIGHLPMKNIANLDEIIKMKNVFEKSQNIYGYDKEIIRFVNVLNLVRQKNKKQLLLVRGPLGSGKTLFVRSALNKYLDCNEELRKIYFNHCEFIFFNLVDPLTATFPYNIFSFIFRKIYFYIKKMDKLFLLNKLCEDLNLDTDNIKYINFVLSMGKKDVNIREGFDKFYKERSSIVTFNDGSVIHTPAESMSAISALEGPHKIKDSNKIDKFFYEMIKIYKIYLNQKYVFSSRGVKFKKGKKKKTKKIPLILVIDDIHISDRYSMDFIRYLFNNDDSNNNPFIIILVEQTPFNDNYRPILHRELEFFLNTFIDSDDESDNIGADKIITFKISPIFEKDILKNILIDNFDNYVRKNFSLSLKMESINDKIIDFLLMKTFRGVPLLVIELFDSLIKAPHLIKLDNNEFKMSQILIDDNELFDWSNIYMPYIYEKITSVTINNLLSFKEILLLKYACTIGTIFDVQTLDKINPLNLIIKKEDLHNIMEKLCNEYIIEIFENERMNRKTKKYLICKICFPFMREVLYKKFPITQRAKLHTEIAKLLSGGKKVYYYNSKIEGQILNRHLLYSEINVVKEIESDNYPDNIINPNKNAQIMNTNNLTVLLVKDICSRIFDRRYKNVLEGDLEVSIEGKWIKISYFVDRQWKMHLKNKKKTENEQEIELIVPIKDIYKNTIIENNILEITIVEYSFYLLNESKEKALFRSENWQDIFNLNTALTFLKMISSYDKYIYNFGYTKFPLYKPGWYARKEKKYYAKIDQNQMAFYNTFKPFRKKRFLSCFGLVNQTDKLITESKDINRPFNVIMRTTFSILLANIQKKIKTIKYSSLNEDAEQRLIHGNFSYLIYIQTPEHIRGTIRKYLDEVEKRQKEEEEEFSRMRLKGKYSIFPLSLLRQEKKIFGSGIVGQRRNQSICHFSANNLTHVAQTIIEEKNKSKAGKNFKGRKNGKSRTIIYRNDVSKQLGPKIKNEEESNILFVDNEESESKNESKSGSESKSSSENVESGKDNSSINFSGSESQSSQESEYDNSNNEKKDKLSKKINNIKTIDPNKVSDDENNLDNLKINEINNKNNNNNNEDDDDIFKKDSLFSNITEENDSNKKENENEDSNKEKENDNNDKKNVININNFNIKNENKQAKIKKNYNINNYINNNISINLINNNYLDSTLKKSFLSQNIINNNYNINIDSLRLSYQKKDNKFLIKTKQRSNKKKSNSAKVKSLKEKFRNSVNIHLYTNTKKKLSLDDDDDYSITSEKESENTDSNFFFTPLIKSKKKNSKIIPDIPSLKDDIFTKTIIAFLLDENTIIEKMGKSVNNLKRSIGEKTIKKNKKRVKRSSLCTGIKFQYKNKNKHVTFNPKKSSNIPDNYERKNRLSDNLFDNDNNNIKRIKFYDGNE